MARLSGQQEAGDPKRRSLGFVQLKRGSLLMSLKTLKFQDSISMCHIACTVLFSSPLMYSPILNLWLGPNRGGRTKTVLRAP